VSSAQLGAARSGAAYVSAALAELGTDVAPDAAVNPRAFAGIASDGRPLASLLDGAVIAAKVQASKGAPPERALAVGGRALERYAATQVADAARGAASVEIAVRQDVGWVRMVSVPCCDRCAVLAGAWYKFNDGFERHEQCNCTHVPAAEDAADDVRTDVDALFKSGQVNGLTAEQRQAVADGADPIQVVNAHRKVFRDGRFVSKASGMTTTAGATKGRLRLSPEGVYRIASDREEALKLLGANGYLR
jgi:hypothetical protein